MIKSKTPSLNGASYWGFFYMYNVRESKKNEVIPFGTTSFLIVIIQ